MDISRAFRNAPVDPRDAVKCGIQHEGLYYLDKFLVFGAVNGTMIFERHVYIDGTFAEGAEKKFHTVCSLIRELV